MNYESLLLAVEGKSKSNCNMSNFQRIVFTGRSTTANLLEGFRQLLGESQDVAQRNKTLDHLREAQKKTTVDTNIKVWKWYGVSSNHR